MSNRDPYSDCWKSPSQPRTRVTFADRVLQECSPDNNQNQGPKGYQDRNKAGLKGRWIEEISLHGAQARQANFNCSVKGAGR